jgi:Flp pilus assembly protein TadD
LKPAPPAEKSGTKESDPGIRVVGLFNVVNVVKGTSPGPAPSPTQAAPPSKQPEGTTQIPVPAVPSVGQPVVAAPDGVKQSSLAPSTEGGSSTASKAIEPPPPALPEPVTKAPETAIPVAAGPSKAPAPPVKAPVETVPPEPKVQEAPKAQETAAQPVPPAEKAPESQPAPLPPPELTSEAGLSAAKEQEAPKPASVAPVHPDIRAVAAPGGIAAIALIGRAETRRQEPDGVRDAIGRAREALGTRDIGRAENILRGALQSHADSPSLHHELGVVHLQFQNVIQARRSLELAHTLDPEDAEIVNDLGCAYYMLGDVETARDFFNTAVKMSGRARHRLNLGVACYTLDEKEQAYAQLTRCLAEDDRYARAHYYLGLIHRSNDRIEDALRHFERAIALEPESPVARQARLQITLMRVPK